MRARAVLCQRSIELKRLNDYLGGNADILKSANINTQISWYLVETLWKKQTDRLSFYKAIFQISRNFHDHLCVNLCMQVTGNEFWGTLWVSVTSVIHDSLTVPHVRLFTMIYMLEFYHDTTSVKIENFAFNFQNFSKSHDYTRTIKHVPIMEFGMCHEWLIVRR